MNNSVNNNNRQSASDLQSHVPSRFQLNPLDHQSRLPSSSDDPQVYPQSAPPIFSSQQQQPQQQSQQSKQDNDNPSTSLPHFRFNTNNPNLAPPTSSAPVPDMKSSILQQSNIPISVQPYPSVAAPTSTSSMHFSAISDAPHPSISSHSPYSSNHPNHSTITSPPTNTNLSSHQPAQVSSSHVGSIISSPIESHSHSATRQQQHQQHQPAQSDSPHKQQQQQNQRHAQESRRHQSHPSSLEPHTQQHQQQSQKIGGGGPAGSSPGQQQQQSHLGHQQSILKQRQNPRSSVDVHQLSTNKPPYDTASTPQTHYSGVRPEITTIAGTSPNVNVAQDAAVSVSYTPLSSQQAGGNVVMQGSSGPAVNDPNSAPPSSLYGPLSGKLSHIPMGPSHHHQTSSSTVGASHLQHGQQQQQSHHHQQQQNHNRYSTPEGSSGSRIIKGEQNLISSMPLPMHPDPVQPFQPSQDVNDGDRTYGYNRHPGIFEEFGSDDAPNPTSAAAAASGNGSSGASGALPPPGPGPHDNDHTNAVGAVDGHMGGHMGGNPQTSSMIALPAISGTGSVGQQHHHHHHHGGPYGSGGGAGPGGSHSGSGAAGINGNNGSSGGANMIGGNDIGENVGIGVSGMGMNVGMGMNMSGSGGGGGGNNGSGGISGMGIGMSGGGPGSSGGAGEMNRTSVGSAYTRKIRTMPRTRAQQMTESQRKQRHNEHTRASRSRIDRGLERLKAVIKRVRPQQKVNKKADVLHQAVKLLKEGFQIPHTESDDEQEPQESSLSV